MYYIEHRSDDVSSIKAVQKSPAASHIPVAVQRSVSPPTSVSPTPSATSSNATTPTSRIPIRSMNAEKRARLSGEFVPEIDESKLSPSEIRALKARKRAEWRAARLKSLEQDTLQAQIILKSITDKAEDLTDNSKTIQESVEVPPVFPRIAVKSRPGALFVREKEKVVDEKVIQREIKEIPDPVTGERQFVTVEYVEKVIETEVETFREKIISLELQDPTKSPPVTPSDDDSMITIRNNNGREVLQLRPDEDQTTFVLRNKAAAGTFDLMKTIDEGRLNESCTDDLVEPPPTPAEINLQERVEADFSSFDEHFGFVNPNATMEDDEGAFELSINDKMKKVLRELKDNERVRLSWSRSMDDEEIDEMDNGNMAASTGEEVVDSMVSYEEKTGSNGTVFMVRERLINDFYTHNDSDSINPIPSLDPNSNFDATDNFDDCQILQNPNAELFLEKERQESARERLTLDLKVANEAAATEADLKTPDTDDVQTPTTPTSTGATAPSAGGNRKKKRKNKNKKK
ncbi:uncharacterized protein LOC134835195 [Culicoides brevitarsis]|uniref:uncharacterized protein LOC134835195 n=1 Tax=Culicoides brevitarsis TaxID=469753 RepID=UPI00307C4DE8